MSEVERFYEDKVVFITGGTGFIGKVLLEKLLRCTEVSKVYLLIREKKGISPKDRLEQLFTSKLFDTLKTVKNAAMDKVAAMTGDIDKPQLGLSSGDQDRVLNEVEVILHCAATVRFDEDLSRALTMNVGAVSSIISLCKSMLRLRSFVHVSTAYCHCQREHIEEASYTPPTPPRKALSLLDSLDTKVLDDKNFTKMIIGDRPNTYTYTKAIAEDLIMSECEDLPVSIVRPSIVVSTWKEPVPGWVDNLNGPTGLFLIAGIGVMRTAVIHEDLLVDSVPVDTCANLIIAAGWKTDKDYRSNQMNSNVSPIRIYNQISGNTVPINWGEIYSLAEKHLYANPLEGMVWYPGGTFKHSITVNRLHELVLHELPAHVTDLVCRLFGRQPFAVRLCDKMHRGMRSLEYFTTHQWSWENNNTESLARTMEKKDRDTFYFMLDGLEWNTFIEEYIKGTRAYVLKQSPTTLAACRRKLTVFWILDNLLKFGCLFVIVKLLLALFVPHISIL
eukprot:GFUD01006292.1.p1 GENE.GFUD01006292.1~~GFUD01006292.1.p1  ORF type:complete len:503 (-),score=131.65 GFUD01006292.1:35-1543(-)